VNVPCKICQKRRAKRYCPGVGGDICPVCCGTERENTIDCPLDCEFLIAARQHEQLVPMTPEDVPNKDIRVSEDFVREHEPLVMWLTMALARAMEKERAVDFDAREALGAIIRTYRTRESGLIYETRPQNPYAAAIQTALQESIEELRKRLTEQTGMQTLRDTEILGSLVFLERIELQHNNGRRRGRAFFDFLRGYLFQAQVEAQAEAQTEAQTGAQASSLET
jgi:hypothetical protein